jgi:hypothetical protein
MLLAAAGALSLGIGSAYADQTGGAAGGYVYPDYVFPGAVYAGAETPLRNAPPVARTQNGRAAQIFGTHAQSQGIWLFPPNQVGGGGSN